MSDTDLHLSLQRVERQLRKGVMGLAALNALGRTPLHGYALAQAVKAVIGANVAEGTLYPLLGQFEADGWVEANWDTTRAGPARKVYTLTDRGRGALTALNAGFDTLISAMKEGEP